MVRYYVDGVMQQYTNTYGGKMNIKNLPTCCFVTGKKFKILGDIMKLKLNSKQIDFCREKVPFTDEERIIFELILQEKTYVQILHALRTKEIFMSEHTIPLKVKNIKEKLKREDLL